MKTFTPILLILLCFQIHAQNKNSDAQKITSNATTSTNKQKVLKLVKQLGADHFRARRAAKNELIKQGYTIAPILKEELQNSKDPEISESLKEIIRKLTFRLHIEQLSPKEKKMALMKFTTSQNDEHEAQAKVYPSENYMVLDINSVRIIIDQKIEGLTHQHTFGINTNGKGGGGSSSTNNLTIYRYSHKNGTGFWSICGEDLTVSENKVKIFGKTLRLNEKFRQILFINKDKTVKGILDIK